MFARLNAKILNFVTLLKICAKIWYTCIALPRKRHNVVYLRTKENLRFLNILGILLFMSFSFKISQKVISTRASNCYISLSNPLSALISVL